MMEISAQEPPNKRTFISHIEIKGLAGPSNPGRGVWSYVAFGLIGREFLHDWGYIGEHVTNYHCEYRALIEALKLVEAREWQGVVLQTGLVVLPRQLSGEWGANDALLPFREEAVRLLIKTKSRVEWIADTAQNKAAAYARFAHDKAQRGKLKAYPLVLLSSSRPDVTNREDAAQNQSSTEDNAGFDNPQTGHQQLRLPNL